MKVTKKDIEARIVDRTFVRMMPTTTTICTVLLDNGFVQVGESAAVDPALFDEALGQKCAYDDAISKLFPAFAFMLLEDQHRDKQDHTFSAALKAMQAGRRVKRKDTPGVEYVMRGDEVRAEYMGGGVSVMVMSLDDLLATDWIAA